MKQREREHYCALRRAEGETAETTASELSAIEEREVSATTVRRMLRDWDEAETGAKAARALVPAGRLRRWLRVTEPGRAEGGA